MVQKLLTCASIGLCLGLAGVVPSADAASPAETAAALEFDTRLLEHEVGARLEAQIVEQLGPKLTTLGLVVVAEPATAPTIIHIKVIAFDANRRDYEVEIERRSPGVDPVGDILRCDACNEQRLVSQIVDETPGLLESVQPQPLSPPPRPPPPPAEREAAPIGPIGIVGAVIGTAGIGGAALGIYAITRGTVDEPSEGPTITSRNYVPVGAVATAVGAASLVVGVALVAFDVKRRRSSNRRFGFHTSPTYVGIQVEQRF